MLEDVLRDRLVLRGALRDLERRADHLEQPEVGEQAKGFRWLRRLEHLGDLLLDPLTRQILCEGRRVTDRVCRTRVDHEAEPRREADRAEHPQGVFREAFARLTDGAHDAGLEILLPAEGVDELAWPSLAAGAPGHRAHGEVAARETPVPRPGDAQ